MRWLTTSLVLGLAVTLIGGSVGCNKNDPQTTKGAGNKELTLKAIGNESITQGGNEAVDVSVSRKNFNDPVEITFENLPAGVTVADKSKTIPKDSDSTTFNLTAAADAKPVTDHIVNVKASGGGLTPPAGSFKLTVKQK